MKHNTKGNIRRVTTFGLGLALGLSFLTGTASAAPAKEKGDQGKSSASKTCDGGTNPNERGANQSGPYNNTCPGGESANGNGGGDASGRPCAGCVGNADDKNPPGQEPGPQDDNKGYECDENNGIGKGNPAHTGCEGQTPSEPSPDNTPPACPAGEAAMKAHSFVVDGKHVKDITGKVATGDTVKVNFTIAANCPTQKVSLVSYVAQSATPDPAELKVHLSDTGTFGPGEHSLTVNVPSCFFQVDFVLGDVITKFESGMTYGDRQIDRDNGGSSCVAAAPKDPGNTPGNTPVGTPVQTVVTTGSNEVLPVVIPAVTVDSTPIATNVLGTEIAAAPAAEITGAVDGGAPAVTGGTSQLRGRPTQVLGVQLERGADSGLARTGFSLLPFAGLGTALCLLGVALTSARKRSDDESVAVDDRLAGF